MALAHAATDAATHPAAALLDRLDPEQRAAATLPDGFVPIGRVHAGEPGRVLVGGQVPPGGGGWDHFAGR